MFRFMLAAGATGFHTKTHQLPSAKSNSGIHHPYHYSQLLLHIPEIIDRTRAEIFQERRTIMKHIIATLLALATFNAFADITVPMHVVTDKGVGASVGQVTISESKYGLVFTPELKQLVPGVHGFHLHQNPSCEPAEKEGKMTPAQAAGDHYDPSSSKKHGAPWGDGHLGDLPPIYVTADGFASQPVLAPRLKLAEVKGHALMIHAGGDNHADHPAPLGGGGVRVACGVVK
jgi:Cu-Zn family superoxide dismutase